MESITLINGNGKPYTLSMPKIAILTREINDVALAHIAESTGLNFTRFSWWYEAQPTTSAQLAALFLTYNFKTRYYNNATYQNTLFLKFDHHIGFDVDTICRECCDYNHIHTDMPPEGRLAC